MAERPCDTTEVREADEPDRGDEPSAYAVLAAHARRASDGRLAAYATAGVLALAAGAVAGASWWWLALLPVVVIGALGAWGIADRELADRQRAAGARGGARRRTLLLLRGAAAVAGTMAAVGTLLMFLAAALGRMIS